MDLCPPLVSLLLLDEFEAGFFIQMPCSIEPFEGPEVYSFKTLLATKADSVIEELGPGPFSA